MKKARFLKRAFSFVVDFTLVAIVALLLYLFPFSLIINNSICKNFKSEIEKPYNALIDKYSGSSSLFGATSTGLYQEVYVSLKTNMYMTEDEYNKFNGYITSSTTKTLDYLGTNGQTVLNNFNTPYDSSLKNDEQLYMDLYLTYMYVTGAHTVLSNYPMNDTFTKYEALYNEGSISKEDFNNYKSVYKKENLQKYLNCVRNFLIIFNKYSDLNKDAKIKDTLAYTTIASSYNTIYSKYKDALSSSDTNSFESSYKKVDNSKELSVCLQEIYDYIINYSNYTDLVFSKAYLGETIKDSVSYINGKHVYNDSNETYMVVYYALYDLETIDEAPYSVQMNSHYVAVLLYALISFAVLFIIYTVVFKGKTLGRRACKIEVRSHKNPELKPSFIQNILHDTVFKFIYIFLLLFIQPMYALIMIVVMLIVDIIMIRFAKPHRALRDIISSVDLVQSEF